MQLSHKHKLLCVSVAALLTCIIHVCLSLCTSHVPFYSLSIFSHGLYPFHVRYHIPVSVLLQSCPFFKSPPPPHLSSRPFNKSVILAVSRMVH